jgi:uncharacterized membrane protein
MTHVDVIEAIAGAIEATGVAVVLLGLLLALRAFVRRGGRGTAGRVEAARAELARLILLGLEILVAADIVRTVALSPTLVGVGVLGLIVLVRSFLSWSLTLELEGRWPWQRPAPQPAAPSVDQPVQ